MLESSLRNAVRSALADYFTTQLLPTWPELQVSPEWPAAKVDLPAQALTIVTPPGDVEITPHAPIDYDTTEIANTVNGMVLVAWGYARLGLQLDLWSQFPAIRDQLARDVDNALNRPAAATVGDPTRVPEFKRAIGLVIRVPMLFDTLASFDLRPLPPPAESARAAQVGEWRQTWQGKVTLSLVDKELHPLMKKIFTAVDVNDDPVVTETDAP